jgi:hypothetical protein
MVCVHHTFVYTGYSKVCTLCGLENTMLEDCTPGNCGFQIRTYKMRIGYSRCVRFRKLVSQILLPTITNQDESMLRFLKTQRIRTVSELMLCVKKAPLKDKRFHAIHAYSRVLLNDWVRYDPLFAMRLVDKLCRMFKNLECKFERKFYGTKAFVNYKFVLHTFFDQLGLVELKQYVPKMKCQKRTRYYTQLLCELDCAC